MLIGLTEAAKLTGRDNSTITRAAKSGKLPAMVGEDGKRRFAVDDLRQWAGLKDATPAPDGANFALETLVQAHQREIAVMQAALTEMAADRDHWRRQAEAIERLIEMLGRAGEPEQKKGWFKR